MVRAEQSRDSIAHDLRRLGLSTGDAVVLHSSLRAIGVVEGGATTVVQALLDVIGLAGALMVPTFSYVTMCFDPASEPSLTGAITETVRRWPGAVRSLHPTHSVAVIGRDAAALAADHHRMSAIAVESPLGRMAARGGKVLLLGCGHNQNTTIHVGEIVGDVPYKDVPWGDDFAWTRTVVAPEGELDVPIIHPSGCSKAFGAIEWHLRRSGLVRDGIVGSALCQLMRGADVIATTATLLRGDPAALLCTDPVCPRCVEARVAIAEARYA